MKRYNKDEMVICYAIIAILSVILAFVNFTNEKIPLTILWTINSAFNLIIGYWYYNQN